MYAAMSMRVYVQRTASVGSTPSLPVSSRRWCYVLTACAVILAMAMTF